MSASITPRIYGAARHPKSFLSLDDADHLLSRTEDAAYAASLIAAWAGRYPPAPLPESAMPAEAGVVVRIGARDYTSTVRAGRRPAACVVVDNMHNLP